MDPSLTDLAILKSAPAHQQTIIYLLLVRNPRYNAYFSFLIFWVTFGGEMGVATTPAPIGPGSSNPAKKLATGRNFWANHYLEIIFRNIQGLPPPP